MAAAGGDLKSLLDSLVAALEAEKAAVAAEQVRLSDGRRKWSKAVKAVECTVTAEPVELVVGGTRFVTSAYTLAAFQDSYFHDLVGGSGGGGSVGSSSSSISVGSNSTVSSASSKVYTVDRDPRLFDLVLDYLRGVRPRLELLPSADVSALREEAEFYRLTALVESIDALHAATVAPSQVLFPGPNYTLDAEECTATKTGGDPTSCDTTILGPRLQPGVPLTVRVLTTAEGNVMVGCAPARHILQASKCNYNRCGWYLSLDGCLYAEDGTKGREYRGGGDVPAGAAVTLVLSTKRQLSFSVDGVDCGEAFVLPQGQDPLQLVVLLWDRGDRVRLEPALEAAPQH